MFNFSSEAGGGCEKGVARETRGNTIDVLGFESSEGSLCVIFCNGGGDF